ncbi:MAG: hypothetical protein EOP88_26180 [Verrucomicrobiaceae bacterium]|nr:MAG: hypothetical protein EOP88_26180 [Verrucomicrobiaceae bacterium]
MKFLPESIEALYAAFADVPRPAKIEGCDCCVGLDELAALVSQPLRTLGGTQLTRYASSAFLTVGEKADYLYLLPRIVEISCTDPGWWPDVEITGQAIGQTDPTSWPEQRRFALLDVFHAVMQSAIDGEHYWMIDEWICCIGRSGLGMAPFLKQIEGSPRALLEYYEINSEDLMNDRLGNSFWQKTEPAYQEIIAWFGSPAVTHLISEAYAEKYNPS